MQVRTSLRASGRTHPGLHRELNEDRFHYDAARGIFLVIDGVGGQAAGEKAAETALTRIREYLEAGSGGLELRIRQAITRANNEIYQLATRHPEWKGMACVLTVVVLDGAEAVVGHVGDTRLYKVRGQRIEKVTRDHSPVGEREDSGELSEADAMRHPRRNEVYRDVGSEPHDAADPDFVDTLRIPFEPDAALVLCSDGLSDLVESDRIRQTVEEFAGHPYEVVSALIDAANDAGGKDNVTVVYVEGSRFAEGEDTAAVRRRPSRAVVREARPAPAPEPAAAQPVAEPGSGRVWRVSALIALLTLVIGGAIYQRADLLVPAPAVAGTATRETAIVVRPGDSISAAIARASAGMQVVVEPGEYRERLRLKTGVSVRSRTPRGVSLRLPGAASESEAAIVAEDVFDAEIRGFRIVGDAATPLGTGVLAQRSNVDLTDLEVSGARSSAIVFGAGATGTLSGSLLHGNPGTAITIRTGAEPRIVHNEFSGNATSERASGIVLIEADARPEIRQNVFVGVTRDAIVGATGSSAGAATNNWFIAPPAPPAAPGRGTRRGGR